MPGVGFPGTFDLCSRTRAFVSSTALCSSQTYLEAFLRIAPYNSCPTTAFPDLPPSLVTDDLMRE